jgi:hypothetical protein
MIPDISWWISILTANQWTTYSGITDFLSLKCARRLFLSFHRSLLPEARNQFVSDPSSNRSSTLWVNASLHLNTKDVHLSSLIARLAFPGYQKHGASSAYIVVQPISGHIFIRAFSLRLRLFCSQCFVQGTKNRKTQNKKVERSMRRWCIHYSNRLHIIFILFIAHTAPLIASISLPLPSVQDAVPYVPAMLEYVG